MPTRKSFFLSTFRRTFILQVDMPAFPFIHCRNYKMPGIWCLIKNFGWLSLHDAPISDFCLLSIKNRVLKQLLIRSDVLFFHEMYFFSLSLQILFLLQSNWIPQLFIWIGFNRLSSGLLASVISSPRIVAKPGSVLTTIKLTIEQQQLINKFNPVWQCIPRKAMPQLLSKKKYLFRHLVFLDWDLSMIYNVWVVNPN